MIFIGILILIIGILDIVIPKKVLMLGKHLQFKKNPEINPGAIFFTRISGVFIVILAGYAILISLK